MQPILTSANLCRCLLLLLFFITPSLLHAQPPIPVRAMTFGNTDGDVVNGIATDKNGNSFYTGMYSGTTDFDPGPGVANHTTSSGLDVFVLALGPTGEFLWVRSFGSPNSQVGYYIETDNAGNVYVAGWFSDSVDFDPGPNKCMKYSNSGTDAYFLKLDASGNFVWVSTFGSTGDDWGTRIHADPNGNVYMMGIFKGTTDFDPSGYTHAFTSAGDYDIFIVKVDDAGDFVWAGQIGGTGSDGNTGLDIDASGNVYIAGYLSGTGDLDPGTGVYTIAAPAASNGFVEKLNSSGKLIWARMITGDAYNIFTQLQLDNAGHLYCIGDYQGTADLDPGAGVDTHVSDGGRDLFVLKLDTSSSKVWIRTIAGATTNALSVDAAGNTYIAGRFGNTVDFDPGPGTANLTSFASSVYTMKLTAAGNYVFAMEIQGTWIRHIGDVEVQGPNIYVAGYFGDSITFGDTVYTANAESFDLTPDAFIFTYAQPTEGTLPLTLLHFDARLIDEHPHLKWITQQEENVSHFVVERSSDGRHYAAIAEQRASGNLFTNEYNYIDPVALSGTLYYRLKCMDRDGSFRHSPVRIITASTNNIAVKVYPVPARGQLTINTMTVPLSTGRMVIELYSHAGVLVNKRAVQPGTIQTINLSGLPAGSYTLRIRANNFNQFRRVMIE